MAVENGHVTSIDLNFDGGEGFDDEAIAPHVTTIHVACGGHAGDDASMREALGLARRWGLAIGAHPGYPDRERFGRVALDLAPDAIEAFVLAQVGRLLELASESGARVTQLKPHGALYHDAARRPGVAAAIAAAACRLDPRLIVITSATSRLADAARERGMRSAVEGFADRRYGPDGSLVPRTEPDALLPTAEEAAAQAVAIAERGEVTARGGARIRLGAETLCLHGDTPGAALFAATIRARLDRPGITVRRLA